MRSTYLALILLLTACTAITSDSLLTSGMSAIVTGEATGGTDTEVVVVLRAGGPTSNTFVDLTGDDVLSAKSGEQSVNLAKRSLGSLHSYAGTLPVSAENSEITISLTRTIDSGAPATVLTLPAPFTVTDHAETVSATQDLSFSWDPSGSTEEMEVVVEGECILAYTKELDGDAGSAAVEFEELTPIGEEAGTACQVTAKLRRVRGGQLDAAFEEGGVVQGIQSRSFTAQFSN
jgi:hypothetical protein